MAVAPEEVREKARTVERQGKGLLVLINQLLNISKTKLSAGNPDWKNGNITAHLGMIIETCRDYARSRNIDLQFLPEGEIVMDSLLSNAFKFTPRTRHKVSVTARREDGFRRHRPANRSGRCGSMRTSEEFM